MVSGGHGENYPGPFCCAEMEIIFESSMSNNFPSLVGSGFGDGAYSYAYYLENTNRGKIIRDAFESMGFFFDQFSDAVSGPPIR